jgi:hypothetical protein
MKFEGDVDQWLKENPPVVFYADVVFVPANQRGKSFDLPVGPANSGFEFRWKKQLLICRCFDFDGATSFKAGGQYRMRVELPSGRAYEVMLKEGEQVSFGVPPDFVVANGVVTADPR